MAEKEGEGNEKNLLKIRDVSSSSITSMGGNSDDLTSILGFDVTDVTALETVIFQCINDDNATLLLKIFEKFPSDTTVLQVLLTTSYPNRDGFYRHDPDVMEEAAELLGPSLENLNALQIACLLGEEDIAMDILDFVIRITDEIQSKKILYEFMGRVWGDGNTTLHLASFMGMTELVSHLLELGAAKGKSNNRKYKPVDCTNDQQTREAFENVEEGRFIEPNSRPSPIKSWSEDATLTVSSLLSPTTAESPSTETHKKSSSNDPPTRPRSVSNSGKPKSHRSGTFSQKDFPAKMLAREKKRGKSVKFDKGTLLLHLCQFRDNNVEHLEMVLNCLGLEDDSSVCTLDVNNTYSPQQWLTPLHIACSYGHIDIATILIERAGAAVNITDKEGWTPLHCACAEGQIEAVKLLLKCQGNSARKNEGAGKDWIYALDGPINLEQENDDGDIPEEVSLEEKAEVIEAILKECKQSYPPPPRVHRESIDKDEDDNEEEEDSEEEEESEKKPVQRSPPTRIENTPKSPSAETLHRINTNSGAKSTGIKESEKKNELEAKTFCKMDIPTAEVKDPSSPKSPNENVGKTETPPPSRTPEQIPSAIPTAELKVPPLPAKVETPAIVETVVESSNIPPKHLPLKVEKSEAAGSEDIIPFPSSSTTTTPIKERPKLAKLNMSDTSGNNSESLNSASVEGGKRLPAIRKGSFSKEAQSIQSPSIPSSDFVAMSGEQMKRPLQRRSSKSGGGPNSTPTSKIGPGDAHAKPSTHQLMGGISALKKTFQPSSPVPAPNFNKGLPPHSDFPSTTVASLKSTFQQQINAPSSQLAVDSTPQLRGGTKKAHHAQPVTDTADAQSYGGVAALKKTFQQAPNTSSVPQRADSLSSKNPTAISDKTSSTLANSSSNLKSSTADLKSSTNNLKSLTNNLKSSSTDLKSSSSNLRSVTADLKSSAGSLASKQLSGSIESIAKKFDPVLKSGSIQNLSDNVPEGSRTPPPPKRNLW